MKKVCLFLALAVVSIQLAGQSNPRISVQGILKTASGAAVEDGSQSLTFRLYHSSSGGTAFWEESASVTVSGGVYSHILGSVTPLTASNFSQTVYLGIVIGGEELSPRTELTHAPYTSYASSAGNGVPPGCIMPFAGPDFNIPAGWLKCDGRALSSATYPALYEAISTTWGTGGGGNDFNLPDLRGVFLRGIDDGRGFDPGRSLVAGPQADATALPNNPYTGVTSENGVHTHGFEGIRPDNDAGLPYSHSDNDSRFIIKETQSAGAHSHIVSINGGGDSETRPINIAMYFIIKT